MTETTITKFNASHYFPSSTDLPAFAQVISKAQGDFEALAEKINASAENATDANKDVKDAFLDEHEESAKTIVSTLVTTVVEAMDNNPGLSYAIQKALGELNTCVKEWAEMDISVAASQKRKDATEDRDLSLVEVAEQIRDHMKNLVSMAESFVPNKDIDPKTNMNRQWEKELRKAGVHLTTRTVKGGNISTYPTTNRLNISDRTNVGRGAKRFQYKWSIDGTMLDKTNPRNIILRSVQGSWQGFLDHLKGEGINFGGESFKTTYNGHEIVASVTK